jgi:hypothetical protein
MAEAKFYPEVADARPQHPDVAQPDAAQPDLAKRVAELEQVVATLSSLHRERSAASRLDPADAVALTAALHPGGMRSARMARRRTSNDGTLPMRFVLFDSPNSR